MKTLDDIIAAAVDHKVPLATVLRQGLVLASALKNDKLKAWALYELNGYPDGQPLPDYRTAFVEAVGFFIGGFGSTINGQPLNAAVLNEKDREWAMKASFHGAIAAYEHSAADPTVKTVSVNWPGYLIARYQTAFMQDKTWVLNRAHQVVPRAILVHLVESVRNKLLEFALEIRNDIGSSEPTPDNPPPAVVEKHVVTIIYGGNNVIGGAVGGDVIQGSNQTIVKGDFAKLSGALKQIGISDAAIGELKVATEADIAAGHKTAIGPKAENWLKSLASGTFKVGAEVVKTAATAAILAFLGIGGAQ